MAEAILNTRYKRNAGVAVVLSLIMAGLGHIYCGKMVKGLVLAFLANIPIPVFLWGLSARHSVARFAIIGGAILVSSVVWLVAVIDSYYTAKHTRRDYQLKDYNRWYVYVLMVLLVGMMSTGAATQTALYIRAEYIEAFIVPSNSMHPTIFYGDRLLANKTVYKKSDPERGDVVVFLDPDHRWQNFVKRVVAVAGDTVAIKDGELYVNGEKLKREKLPNSPLATLKPDMQGDVFCEYNGPAKYKIIMVPPKEPGKGDLAEMTVPEYHCFVLGDNRNYSEDSRVFGPIPVASIKGRFDYLYWPTERWSRLGRIDR